MLSKSGKVEWSCPECGSIKIQGPFIILGQQSGGCGHCNTWWPWRSRIKKSVKKLHNEIRKRVFCNSLKEK